MKSVNSIIKAGNRILILIAVILCISSCCTKKDCDCPEVKIDIYTTDDGYGYSIIRTTKSYKKVDSVTNIHFYSSEGSQFYPLTKNSFNFTEDESLSDFNYILKNSNTSKLDTISNISYDQEPYSFECNDCFLAKDITYCQSILNPKLTYNGELINELKVTID